MKKMILFIGFLMILPLNIVYADRVCRTMREVAWVERESDCEQICERNDKYSGCNATWDGSADLYACLYRQKNVCTTRPNDIYVIQRTGTGSGTTEVHILDRTDNFQNFTIQSGTALPETGTGGGWAFAIGTLVYDDHAPEYNYDDHPYDIYAIKRAATGSGNTEVHIIDGVHDFDNIRHSYVTALPETGTDGDWVFKTGGPFGDGNLHVDQYDIFAIKRANTGTGKTEVHILDGDDNYQSFLLRTGTALPETGNGNNWAFSVGDYNGDGNEDIFAIKRSITGTGTTEVHILNGADNYQSFLVRTGTALPETGSGNDWAFGTGDFNNDGSYDVFAIKRANTGTGTTEVHILNGADNYQSFLLRTGTALNETDSHPAFEFCITP